MFLYQELKKRVESNSPVKVGLIGAGKFGSMFLSQVPTTSGLEVVAIADLNPKQAKQNCNNIGWDKDRVNSTVFFEDVSSMIKECEIEVIVEATGDPLAGTKHALMAIEKGVHIIMVNVEADVLAGAELSKKSYEAGIVYSMAYGDQPALTTELVEWARSCGFNVVAAGKGTKYLPQYHSSTPDTVWQHYGLNEEQAFNAGMNSRMFNSFLDGTKSALEMAAISNSTLLSPPSNGLLFPPAGMDDLGHVLRPISEGGVLEKKGMVEVVSSLERDGRPVFKDLRWGVYVVVEAPNDYTAGCFKQYGMNTDSTGQYSAMYKPFHLIGLELNISILAAALMNKSTGSTLGFVGDVIATAKVNLSIGQELDGEGGFTVWGKLYPAQISYKFDGFPIGLANKVKLKKAVKMGEPVRWSDVEWDTNCPVVKLRRKMTPHNV